MTDKEIFEALLAGKVLRAHKTDCPASWCEYKLDEQGRVMGRGCTAGKWTTQHVMPLNLIESKPLWTILDVGQSFDDVVLVDQLMGAAGRGF